MSDENTLKTTIIGIAGDATDNLRIMCNYGTETGGWQDTESMIGKLSFSPQTGLEIEPLYETSDWLTSMAETKDGKIYSCSMRGLLHYFKSNKWRTVDLNCIGGIASICAADNDHIFAVGRDGECIHIGPRKADVFCKFHEMPLNCVAGSASDNIYAVGDYGLTIRYDGKKWNRLPEQTGKHLLYVRCFSKDEIYLCGHRGIVSRGDGENWEKLHAPDIAFYSLARFNGTVYAAAGDNGLYKVVDSSLKHEKDIVVYRLETIDRVLMAWGGDLLAQYDGVDWWSIHLDEI